MLILGIETSCDETSAAVFHSDEGLLSNVVHSQIETHAPYGGVVPELASRDHLSKISFVVKMALTNAKVELNQVNGIAYTAGPGLIGALMVGANFAKTIAWRYKITCLPINHLEGHILSPFLNKEKIEFPFLSLLVSGGHTQFILADRLGSYKVLGESVDDAVGEAFDKVAKMIGFGYPGGPAIEQAARQGNPGRFKLPRPMLNKHGLNMSFSGLKTSVMRALRDLEIDDQVRADISREFLQAVSDVLVKKVNTAIDSTDIKKVIVSGGVSANQFLRQNFNDLGLRRGVEILFPPLKYSTDNAAMIALAGSMRYQSGDRPSEEFSVLARWPVELLKTP